MARDPWRRAVRALTAVVTLTCAAAPARGQATAPRMDTLVLAVHGVLGRVDTLQVGSRSHPDSERVYRIVRARGTRLRYELRAAPAHDEVAVARMDSTDMSLLGSRGTFTLSGNVVVMASASPTLRLQRENRKLYDLERRLYTSSDPRAAAVELNCEMARLYTAYGEARATRLIDEANRLAERTVSDSARWRVDVVLDGEMFGECEDERRALRARSSAPAVRPQ